VVPSPATIEGQAHTVASPEIRGATATTGVKRGVGGSTFVYKIHSSIDGLQPRSLAAYLSVGDRLALPWPVRAVAPRPGNEVWVHFSAPPRLRAGVYVTGVIESIDRVAAEVLVRIHERTIEEPLDDPAVTVTLGLLQANGYQQVFLLPDERAFVQVFTLGSPSAGRRARHCDLPIIAAEALAWPPRLSCDFADFAPAFWVLPADSFLYSLDRGVRSEIAAASDLCLRFKFGEVGLAAALAIGVYEALAARGLLRFDCVTPIPLSPEKAGAGKVDRARSVGVQVARLLGTSVLDLISLKTAISKGALRRIDGLSAAEFEAAYAEALDVDEAVGRIDRLLIIDDICNEGSTLSAALASVREANEDITAVGASAGQMASRAAVRDRRFLLV